MHKNYHYNSVKAFRNIVELFAERVHECVKGAGTDDDTLIQIIVTRSEVHLAKISSDDQ